jgi:protein phosphatase
MWMTAETHVGQRRATNQDTYRTGTLPEGGYLLVCDGMGGERGGNVASALAADAAVRIIARGVTAGMGEVSVRRVLECAGAAANAEVYDRSRADHALTGMGTTLACVVVTGKTAHVLHAGDSRVYLLRDDLLNQLTTDHTVVQMLVDRGDITEQAARTHPQRNYITRAVGVERQLQFDIFTIDLQEGDALLVCSDGLYNYVPREELCALTAVCVKQRDVHPLIDCANENGGGDNITAALCRIEGGKAYHG